MLATKNQTNLHNKSFYFVLNIRFLKIILLN